MKRITAKDIVLYEELDSNKKFNGTLKKNFASIKTSLLKEFFTANKNNGHYASYLNNDLIELFDENLSEDDCNDFIKGIVKRTEGHLKSYDGATHEVLSSRICNLFGVETAFNSQFELDKSHVVFSLNFLRENEKCISLDQSLEEISGKVAKHVVNENFNEFTPMEKWLGLIKTILNNFLLPKNPRKKEIIQNICEDFLVQILVKSLLLNDQDIKPYNFSIIFDEENNTARLAPAHDFEFTLSGGYSIAGFFEVAKNIICYMQKFCPDRLTELMTTIAENTKAERGRSSSSKILQIIKKEEKKDTSVDFYYAGMKQNIDYLSFAYGQALAGNLENVNELANKYREENIM